MHLIYCKYMIVKEFGILPIEEYPFYKGISGFFTPQEITEQDYAGIIEYLKFIHEKAMSSIARLEISDYHNIIEEWNMTFKEAAIWLCSHDLYHIAQIRNMGLEKIRKKKLPLEIRKLTIASSL